MNGQLMDNGSKLYVSRAQKKKERQQELMRKHEAEKMERYNRLAVPCGIIMGRGWVVCRVPPIGRLG